MEASQLRAVRDPELSPGLEQVCYWKNLKKSK